ncbi:LysR family transcriptional regulator [Flavimaricola marinus]|uniref:DNA-binding transcriptional regulator IlvY n=1 Tax=Flavimaricola marinus TaxID=1819565 RepID=A0A238LFL1_9RHOB|nr:LysR family transcriptional regulator [Flavimaricola marinus]SMY08421.1 DNA-binding transcriptional regulator IlvY [Flavimaricola marinus]
MDKWTELRTAYQVAKLGTVSAAADVLGLHRATVNRHIDALEAAIGAKIFIRHARGYALTEIGEDVLRVAQKTEELIEDLAGRVQGGKTQIEGEIKLTVLAPFAVLLMDAIMQFRAENPQCRVDIDVGEDLARLEYGEAHIALRAGRKPEHPDYVVSGFGEVSFNLYAHERYIARHGMPAGQSDLAGHTFVIPEVPEGRLPFEPWIKDNVQPDRIALQSRDIGVAIEAISAGVGMGFVSDHEARVRGKFHAVLPPNPIWVVPGWVVTHVDLHRTEKVQAMLACIKAHSPFARKPKPG